ncbi:MAG: ATP-binding protein [Proteobacteria bacterium]|nr:ATP-binding protein [Pseudomonadota bacterium]
MNEQQKLFFQVNAGIKNIVGKELIHSDSIAIIELIKNSKDADATKSTIRFINEQKSQDSSLIIFDNGKGMTLNDLKNKWLNVAYSEKKENMLNKLYAGNKGVGRFSCDRLGKNLTLYTKAREGNYIKLSINWEDFENKGINDEMSTIPVLAQELSKHDFLQEINVQNFTTGTILKIENLRETWPATKLRKLIAELEKFSPSIDDDFSIFLYSDNQDNTIANKLNRRIENNILEKVSFKTTHIESFIDEEGKSINTTLYYQNKEVFHYSVRNPFPKLKNIKTVIHYIDPLARSYFTRTVGITPVEYGSIFLFYNNFRISPYGNVKNDWLGLDQRKAQGRARYFGTRELFGRIDIIDKDNTFEVLSNREGLAQNQAFIDLVAYDKEDKTTILIDEEDEDRESYGYITNIIRQLENFVVNGLEWNRLFDKQNPSSTKVISENDVLKNPDRYTMRQILPEKVKAACEKLLKSNWKISDIQINEDLISHIFSEAQQKYEEFLNDFMEKIKDKSFTELSATQKGNVRKIIERERQATKIAEKDRDIAEQKVKQAQTTIDTQQQTILEKEKTIEQINSQNAFLKKTSSQDVEDLIISMHAILVNTSTIRNCLLTLLEDQNISNETKDILALISEANQRNFNIAKFATLYNFSDKQNIINGELTVFMHEYLKEAKEFSANRRIQIHDRLDTSILLNKEFIPLEIMMLLENIISNSKKAKAKNLFISNTLLSSGQIKFSFKDDGNGITEKRFLDNINLIFEKGETSTKGSGIGLYQINKIVKKLKGTVGVKNYNNCFELEIIF